MYHLYLERRFIWIVFFCLFMAVRSELLLYNILIILLFFCSKKEAFMMKTSYCDIYPFSVSENSGGLSSSSFFSLLLQVLSRVYREALPLSHP